MLRSYKILRKEQKSGRDIPAITTIGGQLSWQRKSQVILNYRFQQERQLQHTCRSCFSQHGVNIVQFTKEFNARTADKGDLIIPVVITVYQDRTFSFITKTPPAAVLLKKYCNIKSGSGVPNKTKVASISKDKVKEIAEMKMPDLNAASIEAAMSMIAGTARSMGITVED